VPRGIAFASIGQGLARQRILQPNDLRLLVGRRARERRVDGDFGDLGGDSGLQALDLCF